MTTYVYDMTESMSREQLAEAYRGASRGLGEALERIAELEAVLRDLCDRCETWPNPGDSEALLRARELLGKSKR